MGPDRVQPDGRAAEAAVSGQTEARDEKEDELRDKAGGACDTLLELASTDVHVLVLSGHVVDTFGAGCHLRGHFVPAVDVGGSECAGRQ